MAYVARLAYRALFALADGPPRLVELAPSGATPTRLEQLRFVGRLAAAQTSHADWTLFTHLGLSRAALWMPKSLRRPYATFLHGIEAWDERLTSDRRQALRKAHVLLANSAYTASRVMAAHPDIGPVTVCPLALDPADDVDEPGGTAGAPAGARPTVVIIGRMSSAERYKGHDLLIECWPKVLAAVPGCMLLIIGTGDDVNRLRTLAAQRDVGSSVVFTGFVPDEVRNELLRRASVFAMPSRGEGFGIVYLQAMRAGVPCIGSSADAAGDLIVDGVTGYLVEPHDANALANRLVELLTNAELRSAMGSAGRRRYATEFTFQRFQERLLAALERVNAPARRAV